MTPKKPKPYWTPARIRKLIEASGAKTQDDFGELVGVTGALVCMWLSGKREPTKLMALALEYTSLKINLSASLPNRVSSATVG